MTESEEEESRISTDVVERAIEETRVGADDEKVWSGSEPNSERASSFWNALLDGHWTHVERVETDDRAILVAKRCSPETARARALSARERAIVERIARGATSRSIGDALQLSESAVSAALTRALNKLGLRNRAQLVELWLALMAGTDRSAETTRGSQAKSNQASANQASAAPSGSAPSGSTQAGSGSPESEGGSSPSHVAEEDDEEAITGVRRTIVVSPIGESESGELDPDSLESADEK